MDKQEFLLEIQRLHFEMERCIVKYGMQDDVISLMVTGVVDRDVDDDPILKAIMSFHIEHEDILEEVFEFVRASYNREDAPPTQTYTLDDMLDDAGIDSEGDE